MTNKHIGILLITCSMLFLNNLGMQAQMQELTDSLRIFDLIQAQGESGRGFVKINQDPRLEELTHKHILSNAERNSMPGYRIQIYSGSGSNARNEAMRIQNSFIGQFPQIPAALVYEEPYFKLRVGNYRSKFEGFKEFKLISEIYPQCYFVIEKNMNFPEFKTGITN